MDQRDKTYSIPEIAFKWQQGTATPEEKAFYEQWYASFNDEELDLRETSYTGFDELEKSLYAKIEIGIKEEKVKPLKSKLFPIWFTSAAAILVFAIGFIAYQSGWFNMLISPEKTKSEILPGTNTAILKLSNGKILQLSNSKPGLKIDSADLEYIDGGGIALDKTSAVTKEMEIKTPNGGTYQVELPDGTKVWLNASSSISLPANFSSNFERRLKLQGEAYFEVAKVNTAVNGIQKRRPFIITVDNKSVEVLGTHFNVRAYNNEPSLKATLLEGSVKVVDGNTAKKIVPGEQATAVNGLININKVDVDDVIAWKNGNFQFTNVGIERIMQDIARWYDVEVVYNGPVTKESFGGAISRNKPLQDVLSSLEETGGVHFKIEGRRVIVMP
ncbi:FecR family protein [Pedobacter suwonensis]|uniref:FecR family protein n=1 Tax=Pedobacter suwonensis TaxID=332999 RepID=UPI0011A49EB6|nr:FecR family protein [Pedobacter suwonensis]